MRLLAFLVTAVSVCAQNPLTQAVTNSYNRARQNLIAAADVMPDADYAYKLTPAQRTFGEWIQHTAMGNYSFCAAIKGEQPPDEMKMLSSETGKAELQGALKASFDYCDAALKNTDDKKALTQVTIGGRQTYPVNGMIGLIGSLNEHYGNIVGYLRTKGITPPSSAHTNSKK